MFLIVHFFKKMIKFQPFLHRINKLEVITGTGRGKPSSKGRLRETVLTWLKNKRMNFDIKNGNDGCFVVKFA